MSGIESKVPFAYARGMSQRDIAPTVEEIYGFRIGADTVSKITGRVLEEFETRWTHPLKPFYPFLFVDCVFVTIRRDDGPKNCAVYTIQAYGLDGNKDIPALWTGDVEGGHHRMQVFDEIESRRVEDVLFIPMDGVSGLEDGEKSIFPSCVVRHRIVHLVGNSMEYVPDKDMKAFCAQVKKVYGAASLAAAQVKFQKPADVRSQKYPGAVAVWERNFSPVEQLSTTEARYARSCTPRMRSKASIPVFAKSRKRVLFPMKTPSEKSPTCGWWNFIRNGKADTDANRPLIRNQLACDRRIAERVVKYERY